MKAFNGIYFSSGKVVFPAPGRRRRLSSASPYVQFPSFLTDYKVITIEVWVDISTKNTVGSYIYSFGPCGGIHLTAQTSYGVLQNGTHYIAQTYNSLLGYSQLFVDGVSYPKVAMSTTKLVQFTSSNFLGSNCDHTSLPFVGSFDEARIWQGELSVQQLRSNNLLGAQPDYVIIPSALTHSNINITFYDLSTVNLEVAMFGGSSIPQKLMFGHEIKFDIVPADPQCQYHAQMNLEQETSSSGSQVFPAMNYSIVLSKDTSQFKPPFTKSCINPMNRGETCHCDANKKPYDFFKQSNKLNQTLMIMDVNETVIWANFTYRTGVCFAVQNSAEFSLTTGIRGSTTGENCFPLGTTMLDTDNPIKKSINLTTYLFENYPVQGHYFNTLPEDMLFDFLVNNSTVTINDAVSGGQQSTFQYVPGLNYSNPLTHILTPIGLIYQVKATNPMTIYPYVFELDFTVERAGTDGTSVARCTWFVPVLGILANKLPNYYPVSSDPNLIFLIVRDPPGGGSFATVAEGTQISFGVSIDNMNTVSEQNSIKIGLTAGVDESESVIEAPLGVGVSQHGAKEKGGVTDDSVSDASIEIIRASTSTYDYSMTFKYEFSTSKDPNIAGHPSDLIIGGGIDLIVNEAMQVKLNASQEEFRKKMMCIYAVDTLQWMPGKTTTFVLPVIEIEEIINDLAFLISTPHLNTGIDATDANIQKQIDNWESVLSNYRATVGTTMFSKEMLDVNQMVKAYSGWTDGLMDDGSLTRVLEDIILEALFLPIDEPEPAASPTTLKAKKEAEAAAAVAAKKLVDAKAAEKKQRISLLKAQSAAKNAKKAVADAEKVLAEAATEGEKALAQIELVLAKKSLSSAEKALPKAEDQATKSSTQAELDVAQAAEKKIEQVAESEIKAAEKVAENVGENAAKKAKSGAGKKFLEGVLKGGIGALFNALADVATSSINLLNFIIIKNTMESIGTTCGKVVPTWRSAHLGSICNDFSPTQYVNFNDFIQEGCNMASPSDDIGSKSSGGTFSDNKEHVLASSELFNYMCKAGMIKGNNDIPGGYKNEKSSMFEFLSNEDQYVTFGSSSPLTMSYTSEVKDSTSFSTKFKVANSDKSGLNTGFGFDVFGVGLEAKVVFGLGSSTQITLGRSSSSSHTMTRTVSITMTDNDVGDYFAVKILEDPFYATPIFITMGGQSKCPGETGTLSRESGISIVNIKPRCGATSNEVCDATTLPDSSTPAIFAVQIANQSPTKDVAYYTIRKSNQYDSIQYIADGHSYQCGLLGQTAGLVVSLSTPTLAIPFGEVVEVFFSAKLGDSICRTFRDVKILLQPTCEIPTPNSQVYQYDNDVLSDGDESAKVLYSNALGPQSIKGTFSVAWPANPNRNNNRRRLHTYDNEEEGEVGAFFHQNVSNNVLDQTKLVEMLQKEMEASTRRVLTALKEDSKVVNEQLVSSFRRQLIAIFFGGLFMVLLFFALTIKFNWVKFNYEKLGAFNYEKV